MKKFQNMKKVQFLIAVLVVLLIAVPCSALPVYQVAMTGPPGPAGPGDMVVYQIDAKNIGDDELLQTVIYLNYDPHLTFVGAAQRWDDNPPGHQARILGDTQSPGSTLQLSDVTFRVNPDTPCGIVLDSRVLFIGLNGHDETHVSTITPACAPPPGLPPRPSGTRRLVI